MEFWFVLKKGLSAFLTPISLVLEVLAVGWIILVFVVLRRRRGGECGYAPVPAGPSRPVGCAGLLLVALGMSVLYLGSIAPVASELTRSLERRHPALEEREGRAVVPEEPEFIVVLGGGHRSTPEKPALSRLSHAALARTVGGVDYREQFADVELVFTGHPLETGAMRAVAERLGVPAASIVEENRSRDTKDHAVHVGPIVEDSPFLLVTSATHMPRALGLFRGAGLDPVAAPVDYVAWPPAEGRPPWPRRMIPKAAHLRRTAVALHEFLGLAWARLRGQMEAGDEDGTDEDGGGSIEADGGSRDGAGTD